MRLSLGQFSARHLAFELPGPGEHARAIQLDELEDATGEVTRTHDRFGLRPLTARSATVSLFDWRFGRAHVMIDTPARLSRVAVDAELGLVDGGTLSGRLGAEALAARGVKLVVGNRRFTFDARAVDPAVERGAAGSFATAGELELANWQCALGSYLLRAIRGKFETARVDWGVDATLLGAARATADGLSLSGDRVELHADRVELPDGFRTSGRSVVIPELVIPELTVTCPELLALFRRAPAPPATAAVARAPFDYGFLDRVSGRVDVDLTMDATLPVLGRRKATHHFRIAIADGRFNYRELERDLSDLEDAFIDVEVRGRQLVIERDIPLIPGLEKPLVMWDLDDEELELAKKRLVRLRTLPKLRLPPRKSGDRSSFQLKLLDFGSVELNLTLAPLASERADGLFGLAARDVVVRGALRYAPDKALEPGRASLAAHELVAGPLRFRLGDVGVEIDRLSASALRDVEVGLDGFRPGRATARLIDVRAHNLRFMPASALATAPSGRRATTIPPPVASPEGQHE